MDPKKARSLYLQLFGGNEDLWNEWFGYYNEAVANNSAIPIDIAWIKFKERWMCVPNGGWSRKP